MKDNKCIIHIGMGKTGTTSIQKHLFDNSDALLQQGIYYPKEYTVDNRHIQLAWSLGIEHPSKNPDLTTETIIKSYVSKMKANTLLISSEEMSFVKPNEVSRFINLLSPYFSKITVLCYLSHPAEYLTRFYKQDIKFFKRNSSIDSFLSTSRKLIDYHSIVSRWDIEGITTIALKAFDRKSLKNSDVVSDFFDFIDVDSNNFAMTKRQNVSQKNITAIIESSANSFQAGIFSKTGIDSIVRGLTDKDVSILDKKQYELVMATAKPGILKILDKYDFPDGEILLNDRWKPSELEIEEALHLAVSATLRAIDFKQQDGVEESNASNSKASSPAPLENKPEKLNRRQKILFSCNKEGCGLEIGPSFNPIAPKSLGYNVKVLDHTSQAELREKYKDNKNINIDNIEEVDYIWSGKPLDETTNKVDHFDFIIASHVIEHAPDLIGFLSQCEKMLKTGGVLALAIPDRRFCFDYLRPASTIGEVVQAHIEKRTRHTIASHFDQTALAVCRGEITAWKKNSTGKFRMLHNNDLELAKTRMQHAIATEDYTDVHAWQFTPSSFRLILHDLRVLNYITLSECSSFDTPRSEFIISLNKGPASTDIDRLELALAAAKE